MGTGGVSQHAFGAEVDALANLKWNRAVAIKLDGAIDPDGGCCGCAGGDQIHDGGFLVRNELDADFGDGSARARDLGLEYDVRYRIGALDGLGDGGVQEVTRDVHKEIGLAGRRLAS